MRIVQLTNPNNWEPLYQTDRIARTVQLTNGKTLIERIPIIEVPTILETSILAIEVRTEVPEGGDWNFAGRIYQKLQTGLLSGGFNAVTSRSRALSLEQTNLILFDKISQPYTVSIQVPKYFTIAIVEMWQYTGVDDDSLSVQLSQEFGNINFKLDQIQGRFS